MCLRAVPFKNAVHEQISPYEHVVGDTTSAASHHVYILPGTTEADMYAVDRSWYLVTIEVASQDVANREDTQPVHYFLFHMRTLRTRIDQDCHGNGTGNDSLVARLSLFCCSVSSIVANIKALHPDAPNRLMLPLNSSNRIPPDLTKECSRKVQQPHPHDIDLI